MSDIVIQKLSKKEMEKAQNLYMSNVEISDICTALSIDPDTIRFYVFGPDGDGKLATCWSQLRKRTNNSAQSMYLKNKVEILDATAGVGVEILSRSLIGLRDRVSSGDLELTVDEMAKISKIVVDLDKIVRLEAGTATELIQHVGLSLAEARRVLEEDPFAMAIEAEVVDLPWLKNEEVVDE